MKYRLFNKNSMFYVWFMDLVYSIENANINYSTLQIFHLLHSVFCRVCGDIIPEHMSLCDKCKKRILFNTRHLEMWS